MTLYASIFYMKKRPKIIAIFISYYAEKTLAEFYRNFPKKIFDEIILVDDASKDKSFELSKKLGIISYKNKRNLGYGGNMKRAMAIALKKGGDVIVDIHPDGEYGTEAIPKALKKVALGNEFVLGNRFYNIKAPLKSGMFIWKFFPIVFLNFLTKIALGLNISDYHQGFRVYTKKMLEKVSFEKNSNNFLFSYEILVQAAFNNVKISEVPVKVYYEGDKRGATLKSSAIYFIDVFKTTLRYFMAKTGILIDEIFKSPKDSLIKRIKNL